VALGPYEHLLEIQHIDPATVVRFKQRTILEGTAIEAIGAHLLQLAAEQGRRDFVLNFTGVESMTSAMLGKFVALYHQLGDAGGRMVFCSVDPFLMQIFKVVQMPSLIPIHTDEAEALRALSGDQPRSSPV
jgi:anti-anti-sigma factor